MQNKMILRHSKASPFCRKVEIIADLVGLHDQIENVDAVTSDESDALRQQNPLGKIPVMILEDDTCIYDSDVICDYLEQNGNGVSVLPSGITRTKILTQNALAKGLIEAAVTIVYESRLRAADNYDEGFVDYQMGKLTRALDAIEKDLPALDRLNIANIMTAIALDYLNLRINEDRENDTELNLHKGIWQKTNPKLLDWLAGFKKLYPNFDETSPYRD